jgi:hypothetical protein
MVQPEINSSEAKGSRNLSRHARSQPNGNSHAKWLVLNSALDPFDLRSGQAVEGWALDVFSVR